MATQIKLKRGTSLNSNYTIGAFGNNAEPWFISGNGLNQMYVDGICINPYIKVGFGLTLTETLGTAESLKTYNTLSFDLSTYTSTTMGNALELITSGTAGEIGLFTGYDLFVGGASDTSMAAFVADDAVYIHMRSKNGNNHDKIKIVSGEGATVTAANDIITVSATGVGVTLYDLLWSNYHGSTSSFYDPETTGHTFNVTGGLKFTQDGLVTTLTDTRTLVVGNAKTDVDNEAFTGTAYINLIGDSNSVGTQGVFGSVALDAGTGISLSSTGGIITVTSTVTDTDTHYTSKNIVAGTSSATTEATVASNGVYLNHLEEATLSGTTYILGTNGIKVFSDIAGKINIRGTRIVVSNSETGITDGTSFSGPVYINLVGDNDSDGTLEVLDSVKLVGAGAASLAVGATAKEITITGTDNNTEYELLCNAGEGAVTLSIDAAADPVLIKNRDDSLDFVFNGSDPNSFYIDVVLIDGGTF